MVYSDGIFVVLPSYVLWAYFMKLGEVVLGDAFLRDYLQADFHILITPHGGGVIKFLNVKSDEAGTGGGDCAVQNSFGRR